jgi:hypothetical protein
MGCGGMYYPTDLGIRISELKPGDEVIILKGEGYPAATEETTDIIWQVDRFSAFTAKGFRLSCKTNSDLIVTGRHFEEFLASDIAKAIWKEIQEDLKSEDPESEPE